MWSIYRFTYCSACMAMKFYVLKEDIHVQVKVYMYTTNTICLLINIPGHAKDFIVISTL